MSFKVIAEKDKHFLVRHPDGSEFKVAKAGLDKNVMQKIQHFAKGGMVDPSEADLESNPEIGYPEAPGIPLNLQSANIDPTLANPETEIQAKPNVEEMRIPGVGMSLADKAAAQAALDKKYPQPDVNNDKFGMKPTGVDSQLRLKGPESSAVDASAPVNPQSNPIMDSIQAQKDAIQTEANEMSTMGEAQTTAFAELKKQEADSLAQYQQQLASQEEKRQQFERNIQENPMQANRVWAKASTGNKILAGIGLVLGGIGSGMTGQPNQAVKVIEDIMDRDLKEQQENIGSQKNLLSENLRQTGNINQALLQTRSQQISTVQAKLDEIAANSASPIAQAKAKQSKAGLDLMQAQLQQQMAMFQTQVLASNGGVPVASENPAARMDKEYAAKRVEYQGISRQAPNEKTADELRGFLPNVDLVKSIVNRIDALGPSALIPGSVAHNQAVALQSQLVPALNELNGFKRLSEEDIKNIHNQVKDPTAFRQMLSGGIKNQEFFKTLDLKTEKELKNKLPGYQESVKSETKPGFVR